MFSSVLIDEAFKIYLLSSPLLMETSGAKVIREKDGSSVLIAVASTALNDNSPSDRLRAEKVCRAKALAATVAERKGVQVCHLETLKEKTRIVIDKNGEESGKSVSELIQVTKTKIDGIAKDMPVIGRWRSEDGAIFYLAIGIRIDKKGDAITTGKE